ncbi:polysaccharide deacetylase family protein [Candidatus Thioglobus sp.]|uniref:polysaccharide deacetylase family protein n=1 Tax=Candidatus Thioglobus sp. TaxID=2026721 RepID=UPI003D0CD96F
MLKFVLLILISVSLNAKSCAVLLYHHFSDEMPKSTSISPKLFEQHLQYLQVNEFKVLPLKTLLSKLKDNDLPDRCVVLTTDDAYQSIYTNAYPLLKKYQMPMAVFVATQAIDKNYKAMMSWNQMREIQGEYVKFYNHTAAHSHLLDLNKAQVKTQIEQAQNSLYQALGTTDKVLAYPYGESNLSILKQVEELDYIAFGQQSGVVSKASDLQNLPRFPMAANFAKMKSFQLKVNTLPMPLVKKKN